MMPDQPEVFCQFTVSSGCLCYGALHNIRHGASTPIQSFPMELEQREGGTVRSQILEYNVPASNGIWNAFQLVEKDSNRIVAWFVSHSEVDPQSEIDKILRISGSPYEPDNGSSYNDEKTAAEGVLVINQYDWGHYDDRAKLESETSSSSDDNAIDFEMYEAAGLVDFESAHGNASSWQKKSSREREATDVGIWMHIPNAEYMFGRFGFDQARKAARSFLFFSTNTNFMQTTFLEQGRTLRVHETDEERFQRNLRKGRNFEGLTTLEQAISSSQTSSEIRPENEFLGPYEADEYLVQRADIEAIRVRPGVSANEFAESWKESCWVLLNEMIMAYLQHFIVPATSYETIISAAASLAPERDNDPSLDACMYGFMTNPYTDSVSGYDTHQWRKRSNTFLSGGVQTTA